MTFSEDFIPEEGVEVDDGTGFPTVFGITFTPLIIGGIVAVVGLGISAYIVVTLIMPLITSYQSLSTEVEGKRNQMEAQKTLPKKIAAAKAKLEKTKAQKKEVLALFADEKTLNTVLVDINQSIDTRTSPTVKKEHLLKSFAPSKSVVVDINNKVKRQSYNIKFVGSFDETLSALRSLERLSLLFDIKDFRLDAGGTEQKLVINRQGTITPATKPILQNTFTLEALVPLTAAETAAATPPPPPPPKK